MGADMSTLSSLISGGGGALPQIALTHCQTWVPPQDGNVCIHVIGAGGAGAGGTGSTTGFKSGSAGGYCKKNSLAVTTGGSYTVVVGAGGIGGGNIDGTSGGNSTVAGTGLSATLTANGGSNFSGGGGTAANGDVNNTGGAGTVEGGGGAVGVYGTGEAGSPSSGARNKTGGGSSDAMGPEGSSGFGHISGGGRGGSYNESADNDGSHFNGAKKDGGFLAGGGGTRAQNTPNNTCLQRGGDGGIGAGGGTGRAVGALFGVGGRGGDGLVLIQYLPS